MITLTLTVLDSNKNSAYIDQRCCGTEVVMPDLKEALYLHGILTEYILKWADEREEIGVDQTINPTEVLDPGASVEEVLEKK